MDSFIYSLDGASGTEQWAYPTGGSVFGSPAIALDGTVYAASRDGYLYALFGSDGRLRWRSRIGGGTSASPVVAGDG